MAPWFRNTQLWRTVKESLHWRIHRRKKANTFLRLDFMVNTYLALHMPLLRNENILGIYLVTYTEKVFSNVI